MAKLSWQASTVLATILLVALGLQASAIKILLNLSRQPEPAVVTVPDPDPGPALSGPVTSPATALDAARWSVDDPPLPAEPPHLADLTREAQPFAPEVPPPDPVPAPAPNAAALAMARLAELAEQTAIAPAHSPGSAPKPAEPVELTGPEAVPAESAPATDLRDVDWLRIQDPRRYTIQLFSSKNLDKLGEVAAMIGSDEPRAYFMTGSRTSPWYSLVLGDYPDAGAARAAAANLTASLALKPWVRRFEDIQSSMR